MAYQPNIRPENNLNCGASKIVSGLRHFVAKKKMKISMDDHISMKTMKESTISLEKEASCQFPEDLLKLRTVEYVTNDESVIVQDILDRFHKKRKKTCTEIVSDTDVGENDQLKRVSNLDIRGKEGKHCRKDILKMSTGKTMVEPPSVFVPVDNVTDNNFESCPADLNSDEANISANILDEVESTILDAEEPVIIFVQQDCSTSEQRSNCGVKSILKTCVISSQMTKSTKKGDDSRYNLNQLIQEKQCEPKHKISVCSDMIHMTPHGTPQRISPQTISPLNADKCSQLGFKYFTDISLNTIPELPKFSDENSGNSTSTTSNNSEQLGLMERKALKDILMILHRTFRTSPVACLRILQRNHFNLLTSLQELKLDMPESE